jgi:hypothetical protein
LPGTSPEAWFQEPKGGDTIDSSPVAKSLQAAVDHLERTQLEMARRNDILFYTELYMGRPLGDLYQLSMSGYERNPLWNSEDITFNICYAIVNAIRNRICSFRPRAQFLPNGGDYRVNRAARDKTDISDAWAHKNKYQEEASLMFRDLLIGDGGVLKVDDSADEVTVARYPEWEFLFDEVESRYRKPDCAYHVTYLPIEQASEMYRIPLDQLKESSLGSPSGIVYGGSMPRSQVRIVHAWKRGPQGRTILICGNHVVEGSDREWKYDGWPLILRTFDEGQIGMWGVGAVAKLVDLQLELNDSYQRIREGHQKTAMQVIGMQENETAPTKITNSDIQIVRFKNTPPTFAPVTAVSPDWYQYVEHLKGLGYETLGVSPQIAAGVKPAGLTAAVAIQESTELQQDRLALLSQLWEGTVVETTEWWNRLTGDLIRDGRASEVKYRAIRRGSYSEIAFPMDEGNKDYDEEIRVYPSSIFGATVAGRLERANFLIDKGWLTREDAMRAADVPDLSPIIDLQLAPQYAMESIVDDILEEGKYNTPPPYLNAETLFNYARQRYLLAWSSKANYPIGHMALLSKLIDAIDPTKLAPGVAQQMLPGPPAPPPGAPLPTSPVPQATPMPTGAPPVPPPQGPVQ